MLLFKTLDLFSAIRIQEPGVGMTDFKAFPPGFWILVNYRHEKHNNLL
jgi:hypothetical protein